MREPCPAGAHQLAQFNIATMRHPRWSPRMRSYHENLDAVFPVAKSWPGFVWIMEDDELVRCAESFYGAKSAANISVWADLESLRSFMECPAHATAMQLGSDWFVETDEPTYVFWWVASGHRPTFDEAHERLELLRRLGATANAFSMETSFPPPDVWKGE